MNRCGRERMVEDGVLGMQGTPKDEWSAGSVAELSADKETSRDTSALRSIVSQV